MIEAYPLQWPAGWPRMEGRRQRARFGTSFAHARDALLDEVRLLGGRNVVISSNVALRRDGLPYANQGEPDDPGIAVYFEMGGEPRCFPCDRWDRTRDNLQAIRLSIAALRGLDRWGAKHMVDAAFRGFAALPPPSAPGHWSRELELEMPCSLEQAERAWRSLCKITVQQDGQDSPRLYRLNAAIEQARKELAA